MERPTDAFKETHNITLSQEDTLFGGLVSNLQVSHMEVFSVENSCLSSLHNICLSSRCNMDIWRLSSHPLEFYLSLNLFTDLIFSSVNHELLCLSAFLLCIHLQVAELMAVMVKNLELSYCKVVEVVAETTAPLTPMEELLAKIPSKRPLPKVHTNWVECILHFWQKTSVQKLTVGREAHY